jgi:hypothetical protein
MTTRRVIRDYHEPAGGWGALKVRCLPEREPTLI